MPTLGAIALLVVLTAATFADPVTRPDRPSPVARSHGDVRDDAADELRRLRHNQTVLMAAVNRLITQTAPIAPATAAD
jgi:hypothetical protein